MVANSGSRFSSVGQAAVGGLVHARRGRPWPTRTRRARRGWRRGRGPRPRRDRSPARPSSRSVVSATTSVMRASGRSTLFTTTMTGSFAASALRSTKRVWGSGPSDASTSRTTPSTIDRPRSTSPPKSAWPGVSITLIVMPSGWPISAAAGPEYRIAVFLARIVMPFSRSRSPESITRSSRCWRAPKDPDCLSMASTSVVLPWSTWATIATLRRSDRVARAEVGAVAGTVTKHSFPEGRSGARTLARRDRSRSTTHLTRESKSPGVDRVTVR